MSVSAPVFADFGPLVSGADVDEDVLATLETWTSTYLARIEDVKGLARGFIARPKTYASSIESTEFLDATLPAVFVATARVEGEPIRWPDGSYSADWLVATSCVVRGRNAFETRRLASWTDLAVRKVLVDHAGLSGLVSANGLIWSGGGQVQPLPDQTKQQRYLAEAASTYLVKVDAVVQAGVEPSYADGTPAPDPGTPPVEPFNDLPVPATAVTTDLTATGGN